MNRKKNVTGQASSDSLNTHGEGQGSARPQQSRPQQARPSGATQPRQVYPQQARPTTGAPRPQQTPSQPFRPQQAPSQQARPAEGASRPQQTAAQRAQQAAGAARAQQTASQRAQQQGYPHSAGGSGGYYSSERGSSGGRSFKPLIIIVVLLALLGGGGSLSGLFGGNGPLSGVLGGEDGMLSGLLGSGGAGDMLSGLLGGGDGSDASSALVGAEGLMSGYSADMLQQLLGGSWYSGQTGYGATASSTSGAASFSGGATAALNRDVAPGSRAKYTTIRADDQNVITLMVYMCGADLESKSAMATRDLQEMMNASFGENLQLIVYTGGSRQWHNRQISAENNQIWQIKDGALVNLIPKAGYTSMTSPATLTSFIQYCRDTFPANRYGLILWDHGSGSVSGYGYDEKDPGSGTMNLAGLNTALKDGDVLFDFIGFDTCLMATVETALMASRYADYMIASEETEPGIGWYYTDWLTALGSDTAMPTLDLGKRICDDFVSRCAVECRGQQTTLSVIDLAELEHTVPDQLSAFSRSVSSLISNQAYKTVSNARNGSREFATSSRIDQVDLTDLCNNLGTDEAAALAATLRSAVKYNRINNISNAYGLSIYFPYQRVSNVDKAVSAYEAIGMDDSYAQCIRDFAGIEASGQAVTGGASSAIPSLFGLSADYGAASSSSDIVGQLLSSFLGGRYSTVSGLSGSTAGFLSERTLSDEALAEYLSANLMNSNALAFQQDGDNWVLALTPEQWSLVHSVDLNLFYDNGSGYLDLGLDNLFEFDDEGRLVADTSGTWMALDGQPVAYYHETSEYISDSEWRITGRVPALVNGERMDLIIAFDQDHETGYVAGARTVYAEDETEAVAKVVDPPASGDTLIFLADLYDYDQNFTDSYAIGNSITVNGELVVSDVILPDPAAAYASYRITDIYNQAYWTPVIAQ